MRSDSKPSSTFVERARRAQLVGAAVDVLATDGYVGASLARIAGEAGVSKGVILYHFGSKDELMRTVLTDVYTAAAAEIATEVEGTDDHASRLAAYIEGNLGYLGRHHRQVRALTEILTSFRGEDGRLVFGESEVDSVVGPLQSMLEAGQAAGEFREFDSRVVARSIRAAIDVVTPRLGVEPDLDVEEYAAHLVDLFQHAVKA